MEEEGRKKGRDSAKKEEITYALIVNMLLSPRVMETTPSSQPVEKVKENMISPSSTGSGHCTPEFNVHHHLPAIGFGGQSHGVGSVRSLGSHTSLPR